jgi:hypothetical protein
VTFAAEAGPDKRDYQVDFTKIKTVLPEFVPQWTIGSGITELRDDMINFHLTTEKFEGPTCVRLERIRELLTAGRLDESLRTVA